MGRHGCRRGEAWLPAETWRQASFVMRPECTVCHEPIFKLVGHAGFKCKRCGVGVHSDCILGLGGITCPRCNLRDHRTRKGFASPQEVWQVLQRWHVGHNRMLISVQDPWARGEDVAHILATKCFPEMSALFEFFDVNKDGVLDASECRALVEQFLEFCKNNLEFDVHELMCIEAYHAQNQGKNVKKTWDRDHNARMEQRAAALAKLQQQTESIATDVLRAMDSNPDGEVSPTEFSESYFRSIDNVILSRLELRPPRISRTPRAAGALRSLPFSPLAKKSSGGDSARPASWPDTPPSARSPQVQHQSPPTQQQCAHQSSPPSRPQQPDHRPLPRPVIDVPLPLPAAMASRVSTHPSWAASPPPPSVSHAAAPTSFVTTPVVSPGCDSRQHDHPGARQAAAAADSHWSPRQGLECSPRLGVPINWSWNTGAAGRGVSPHNGQSAHGDGVSPGGPNGFVQAAKQNFGRFPWLMSIDATKLPRLNLEQQPNKVRKMTKQSGSVPDNNKFTKLKSVLVNNLLKQNMKQGRVSDELYKQACREVDSILAKGKLTQADLKKLEAKYAGAEKKTKAAQEEKQSDQSAHRTTSNADTSMDTQRQSTKRRGGDKVDEWAVMVLYDDVKQQQEKANAQHRKQDERSRLRRTLEEQMRERQAQKQNQKEMDRQFYKQQEDQAKMWHDEEQQKLALKAEKQAAERARQSAMLEASKQAKIAQKEAALADETRRLEEMNRLVAADEAALAAKRKAQSELMQRVIYENELELNRKVQLKEADRELEQRMMRVQNEMQEKMERDRSEARATIQRKQKRIQAYADLRHGTLLQEEAEAEARRLKDLKEREDRRAREEAEKIRKHKQAQEETFNVLRHQLEEKRIRKEQEQEQERIQGERYRQEALEYEQQRRRDVWAQRQRAQKQKGLLQEQMLEKQSRRRDFAGMTEIERKFNAPILKKVIKDATSAPVASPLLQEGVERLQTGGAP